MNGKFQQFAIEIERHYQYIIFRALNIKLNHE